MQEKLHGKNVEARPGHGQILHKFPVITTTCERANLSLVLVLAPGSNVVSWPHSAFHFFSPPDISAKDVGIAGFAASANLVVLMKVRKNTW